MTVKHQQSVAITNAQAVPVVPNNTGNGAGGKLVEVGASVVLVAASAQDSTIRFVRVPTNAKVKRVVLTTQTQTAGTIDFGVYYPVDGPTGKADLAANAISQAFFASAVTVTALGATDITNESGSYTADLWNLPLWKALALASDPGGFFDIVGTVAATDITTGTGIIGISVAYVE